jgi:oxepin-CoA hydrolase/3-oxo-5,6-dehydrosuberyl-CoA semialdehyde dehydrogenase
MLQLQSYLAGRWCGDPSDQVLVNPSTEEQLARATSAVDQVGDAVAFAREVGVPALAALTFRERGEILKALSKTLRGYRDELLALSRDNNGTTSGDGAFDLDGAGGTLAYYGGLGVGLGDVRVLSDGDGSQLGRSEAFWTRHVLVPRGGVAVHVNAFNFPAWGLAEKLACAILAGAPVITKPATSTALTAHRFAQIVVESGLLPAGSFQFLIGGTGDLLDRLDHRDVFAFTGSAATANSLRGKRNLLEASVRVNIEADSVNAAVLGPDVEPGSKVFELFVKDVAREITQKAGQKCTAIRRILVPAERRDAVAEALVARLAGTTTGNPADETVRMGPVATAAQLRDTIDGIGQLAQHATIATGGAARIDGVGAPPDFGYFVAPTLLVANEDAAILHHREVFGPCATVFGIDAGAGSAAAAVAKAGGTLVTAAYTDDTTWLDHFVAAAGGATGRVYVGSSTSEGFGSGAALPACVHGGPGRAGGGEELGGLRGLAPYLQRVALQGDRAVVERG